MNDKNTFVVEREFDCPKRITEAISDVEDVKARGTGKIHCMNGHNVMKKADSKKCDNTFVHQEEQN